LALFVDGGYGASELLRQTELERHVRDCERYAELSSREALAPAEVTELRRLERVGAARQPTEDEFAELECLVALRERSAKTPATLEPELIARLAVLCEWVLFDTDEIRKRAAAIRSKLPELSGFEELPSGGWREASEQRVAMFERRAAEAREKR
jgi:hypothetical protein